MATDVTMPRLSDSMEEGTVLKWLVEPGGEVKRGEALVEIETDKANMTYEADTDGTLIEVIAGEGDTLSIGEVIARVGDPSEASQDGGGESGEAGGGGNETATEESEEERSVATAEEDRGDEGASANGGAPAGGDASPDSSDANGRVKASPVARRIAGEQGVDLSTLDGSGPGGRIVKADVLAAAGGDGASAGGDEGEATATGTVEEAGGDEQKGSMPEPQEAVAKGEAGPKGEVHVQELTRLQQTVSRRMAESKATAPDFTLEVEVDMAACVELRGRLKELADPVPSFNDMIV
ncbi:MAG: E3 binding domain-containing protein, partial [Actinomycetota bacterium]|nr:E3 binding domain-containing protein [Actinomycetota bacterium]